MRPEDAVVLLRSRLAALGGPIPSDLWFVDDRAVEYGFEETIYVRRHDLFTVGDGERWQEFLHPPPASWIHFNLLKADDGSFVISIRRGPTSEQLDQVEPAINVSVEPRSARIESN